MENQGLEQLNLDTVVMLKDQALSMGLRYAPKLVAAIIILVGGFWLARIFRNFLNKILTKREVDLSLQKYLVNLLVTLFKVIIVITVIQMLGVQTTSLIAMVGAAGLAVGLALQGSLSNFAGGMLILIFKPFRVGDYIKAQNVEGSVVDIQVFHTSLVTFDGKKITIPNGILSNGTVENYTCEPARRVNLEFGISYNADIDQAKKVIEELIVADDRILKDPIYRIAVSKHGDSAIGLAVHIWCKPAVFWNVYFDYMENVKKAFDQNKIEIPFPQRVIHSAKKA